LGRADPWCAATGNGNAVVRERRGGLLNGYPAQPEGGEHDGGLEIAPVLTRSIDLGRTRREAIDAHALCPHFSAPIRVGPPFGQHGRANPVTRNAKQLPDEKSAVLQVASRAPRHQVGAHATGVARVGAIGGSR